MGMSLPDLQAYAASYGAKTPSYVTGPTASYMGARGQGTAGQMYNTSTGQWETPPASYGSTGNSGAGGANYGNIQTDPGSGPQIDSYNGGGSVSGGGGIPGGPIGTGGQMTDLFGGPASTQPMRVPNGNPANRAGSQFNMNPGMSPNANNGAFFQLLSHLQQIYGKGGMNKNPANMGGSLGNVAGQPGMTPGMSNEMGGGAVSTLPSWNNGSPMPAGGVLKAAGPGSPTPSYSAPYQVAPQTNQGTLSPMDQTGGGLGNQWDANGGYGLQSLAMGNRPGLRSVFGQTGGGFNR